MRMSGPAVLSVPKDGVSIGCGYAGDDGAGFAVVCCAGFAVGVCAGFAVGCCGLVFGLPQEKAKLTMSKMRRTQQARIPRKFKQAPNYTRERKHFPRLHGLFAVMLRQA